MDYQKVYDKLIERGLKRQSEIGTYYERHHIIPKCMGGVNDKSNLVKLTAREHFLVHWLLCRIYPENEKLANAFWIMTAGKVNKKRTGKYKISSRVYEEARVAYIKAFKNRRREFSKGRIVVFNYYTKEFIGVFKNATETVFSLKLGNGAVGDILSSKRRHYKDFCFLRIPFDAQLNIETFKKSILFSDSEEAKKDLKNKSIPIKAFKFSTGQFVGEFKGVRAAALALNIGEVTSYISRYMNGKNKSEHVKGYTFKKVIV